MADDRIDDMLHRFRRETGRDYPASRASVEKFITDFSRSRSAGRDLDDAVMERMKENAGLK